MEHEKVIERGLSGMVDMAWTLGQIRDQRDYLEAGYSTFEVYCKERWSLTPQHVNRVIGFGKVVRDLEPIGSNRPLPVRESQARPLAALADPDAMREAWAEAVDEADGDQPTAAQVRKAVEKRLPPKKEHPAPFSDAILDKVAEKVQGVGTVLDPFAGTGRVHELRERAGVTNTIGVELEPEWAAKHPDTVEGNALDLPFDDESVDAIATSPTYGNRMADHHEASDDSVRLTYKHTLGRDLHEDNSGAMQWGDEYREFHLKAWAESARVLKPGGTFVVNVKDHIRDGLKQKVVAWHINAVQSIGMVLEDVDAISTRGLMAGENHGQRTLVEWVFTFRKPL